MEEKPTVLNDDIKPSFGFTCKICSNTQPIDYMGWQNNNHFPICDECRLDLREFVKEKRAKQANRLILNSQIKKHGDDSRK